MRSHHLRHLLAAHLHRPILVALAIWLIGFGFLGLGTVPLDDPPPSHPLHGRLDKALHFSAFTILAVLLFGLPRVLEGGRVPCVSEGERTKCIPDQVILWQRSAVVGQTRALRVPFRMVFAGGIGGVAAVMSEVVQHLVNNRRIFDWFDILANLLGVALGVLLSSMAWHAYLAQRRGRAATTSITSASELV